MRMRARRAAVLAVVLAQLLPISQTAATSVAQAPDDPSPAAIIVPTNGLLGEWLFNEGTGAVAKDTSGHGLDGAISGATWVTGRAGIGTALDLDGLGGGVNVPDNPLLEPSRVTVAAWVKNAGSPGKWANIVLKGEKACSTASYELYAGIGEGAAFYVWDGSAWAFSPAAGLEVWDGRWHQLVGTYDGSSVRLYVDGAQVGTGTPSNLTIAYGLPTTDELQMGHETGCGGATPAFPGVIDEVRIWGRALSAAEVLAMQPPVSTKTTMTSSPAPAEWGRAVTLVATVSPVPRGGKVTFYEQLAGSKLTLGSASVDPATGRAVFKTSALAIGSHTLYARYAGYGASSASTSPTIRQTITRRATAVTLTSSESSPLEGRPVTLTAVVSPTPDTGSVVFRAVKGGVTTTLGTVALATNRAVLKVPSFAPGSYTITARYGGSGLYKPGDAPALLMTVRDDAVVQGSAPTLSSATFYPVVDGYLDTLKVSGTVQESLSVRVDIYNTATGGRVLTKDLGTRTAAWSLTWDGRLASGAIVADGRYRVDVNYVDIVGNRTTKSAYVTVSRKKLYYYTTSQTKYGDAFSAYDVTDFGWVSTAYSDFYRGVDLYGNIYDEYAAVKYVFTLPAAAVYKSLTFSALGRQTGSGGPATLELWNFKDKSYDASKETGLTYGWYSLTASAANRVSSRQVWAWVTAYGGDRAHWDVAKVKLSYTYGVLK